MMTDVASVNILRAWTRGEGDPARWARLKYGGANRPWHILRGGVLSICGRQSFDYPRREFSIARPLTGKLCGHCLKTEARL